ncbi:hypothetical protein BN2156_04478 [Mycolicibacterium neworleansense]|uniref:Uncharacterized protein n=1 Tax=Mycolicibacterium neworleansense TaxID=146018 RepID=A0A0H5RVM8_9MYCO|nr:hypothetical protein BN2156_04478 [Mycolicibacterium neworleansense]
MLDELDSLEDLFPAIPAGADAYRRAAEHLAYQEGEGCAAVAYAGGQAQAKARWLRLYGRRSLDSLHELATEAAA